MTIRQGDPPVYREELVHGELSQHIADLIACIKMGGGAGVKSELNFCLYCHSRLSSISVPLGFRREGMYFCGIAINFNVSSYKGFLFRNPQQERNNVYAWKSLPSHEERRALFDRTGNCFTVLHCIPGWHMSTSSLPDSMHLLYLGGMNWIIKQVLVGPGIFNKRHPNDEDPQTIFNNCLDAMWMAKNFQRLPPKVCMLHSIFYCS
jgi:hypothetical protein